MDQVPDSPRSPNPDQEASCVLLHPVSVSGAKEADEANEEEGGEQARAVEAGRASPGSNTASNLVQHAAQVARQRDEPVVREPDLALTLTQQRFTATRRFALPVCRA